MALADILRYVTQAQQLQSAPYKSKVGRNCVKLQSSLDLIRYMEVLVALNPDNECGWHLVPSEEGGDYVTFSNGVLEVDWKDAALTAWVYKIEQEQSKNVGWEPTPTGLNTTF